MRGVWKDTRVKRRACPKCGEPMKHRMKSDALEEEFDHLGNPVEKKRRWDVLVCPNCGQVVEQVYE